MALQRLRDLLAVPPGQLASSVAKIPAVERPGYIASVNFVLLAQPDAALRAQLEEIKTALSA